MDSINQSNKWIKVRMEELEIKKWSKKDQCIKQFFNNWNLKFINNNLNELWSSFWKIRSFNS